MAKRIYWYQYYYFK